jgi:hypothetical protein
MLGAMSSWDDVEVDSDGDELLDWLWDIPDRYDVGIEDAEGDVPNARRFRARPAVPGDNPTEIVDPFNAFSRDQDVGYGTGPVPFVAERGGAWSRITVRDIVVVAGVVLVIAAGLGLGYKVFSHQGSNAAKPSKLAVGSPTTGPVTTFDQTFGVVPADTTTSVPPTTEPVTTSSVPAVIAATTSTTARHTTTTRATVPPTTTTTTTVPATTTTEPSTTTTSTSSSTTSTSTTSTTLRS